ncbi:Hypothetical predicted protein [Paramuricea clavata]|uniref:DEAD-box helicase OB fold domain-containing protein n=1 Tax=Paramuricea clavata TaxID=317549 RepID=A0A7D9EEQ2_PARCT|nr:Hypothetical predicted protein [Paramuricea clavata]
MEENSKKPTRQKSNKEAILKALCQGLFHNTARKGAGNSFRTMDGHGTTVFIHPSSAMFGEEADFDWILFHDVIWTSKIYVKTVCPINYERIHDLLPRIHEASNLSLAGNRSVQAKNDGSCHGNEAEQNDESLTQSSTSVERRNNEQSIMAARERYLARKLKKEQEVYE